MAKGTRVVIVRSKMMRSMNLLGSSALHVACVPRARRRV